LNQINSVGADYFVVPMMPDAFSVQGIEKFGHMFMRSGELLAGYRQSIGRKYGNKICFAGRSSFYWIYLSTRIMFMASNQSRTIGRG